MSIEQQIPRIVIAATGSGAGKTTIAIGLMAALRARGLSVAPFKCGPDYLDPTYHARAAGGVSHNLDGWMMGRAAVIATFSRAARHADIAVIEGMMGLYDGASPIGDEGSSAEIAKWLAAPAILVVDASGMARTVAAVAHGFAHFDPAVRLAGLICNRVGSRGHLDLLRTASQEIPVLGGLPDYAAAAFPERHLGLYSANEKHVARELFEQWRRLAGEWFDLDAIVAIARSAPPIEAAEEIYERRSENLAPRCRFGVALDDAFHFYYEDNLKRLAALGAEIVNFSPVRDRKLPNVDGLYFGGGYPEALAHELSANRSMIEEVRAFAARGGPVYAECGGLMYLTRAIRTLDGASFPMVDLIPADAVMHDRLQALGYVEVETVAPSILGAVGLRFRGHQFRYSTLEPEPAGIERVYAVRPRWGNEFAEGYGAANVLATYVHAHWASNPSAAAGLVESCAQFRARAADSFGMQPNRTGTTRDFVQTNARVVPAQTAMQARTLMVQGTASSVGKSLIVTALCCLFRQAGLRVAPFKSQNMALNSFVTPDGTEIGRAQAVQAEAAGVAPSVEMNPILLKPEGDTRSQVVLMGRPAGSFTFSEYHRRKPELIRIIADCLARLRAANDIVVIEGAGSPAEINLASHDIVNMHVAEAANAQVILVGDIDRGGVFAQFVGTIDLLEAADRARVAAFLINKFRGDATLLKPGLDYLEKRFAIPVIGVVPYIPRLRIADEDSVALEDRRGRPHASPMQIEIAIIRLPHISNYDDFLALEHEPGIVVRFAESPQEIDRADLAVIPGSKSTVADLEWMRAGGFAEAIIARSHRRKPIVGICGGCQMLGETIADPDSIESSTHSAAGLNLLPISTHFGLEKRTAQIRARVAIPSLLSGATDLEGDLSGYEIHMGRVERRAGTTAPFRIVSRNAVTQNSETADALDGAIAADGAVVGTMLHGIFENDGLRSALIRTLRRRKGIDAADGPPIPTRAAEYDRLAATVRANIDWKIIERIAGLS